MGRHGGKGRVSDRLANQGCRVLGCDLAIRNRFVWAVAKHHLLDKHCDSVKTRSLAFAMRQWQPWGKTCENSLCLMIGRPRQVDLNSRRHPRLHLAYEKSGVASGSSGVNTQVTFVHDMPDVRHTGDQR